MKHLVATFVAALALALALTTPVAAETRKGPAGSNTEVYTPTGWACEAAQEGTNAILLCGDPKDQAALLYVLVEATKVDAGLKAIDAIVDKLVVDLKLGKGKAVKVGGMKGLAFTATGKAADNSDPATVRVLALAPNTGHMLFVVAMVRTAAEADHAAELKKVLAGIKRVD